MNFDRAYQYLVDLGPKWDKNMDRVLEFKKKLGNPDKDMKIIQVVGTAGKGSTSVYLANLLQSQGYRVGLFISPHLQTILERIQVNGRLISRKEFVKYVKNIEEYVEFEKVKSQKSKVKGHNGDMIPSYFECLVMMALLYFGDKQVDYAVMETGLGGSWDAVSSVRAKYYVFTPIGLDHRHVLGKNIIEIARDKVGAIKRGSVVVTNNRGNALEVIKSKVKNQKSELVIVGQDNFEIRNVQLGIWNEKNEPQKIQRGRKDHKEIILPRFQEKNIELALETLDVVLKGRVDWWKVGKVIGKSFNPGRFELIQGKPVVILDGAHNPMKMRGLVNSLKDRFPGKKFVFVVGFKEKKDVGGMGRYILPVAEEIWVTEGSGDTKFQEIKNVKDKLEIRSAIQPEAEKQGGVNNEKLGIKARNSKPRNGNSKSTVKICMDKKKNVKKLVEKLIGLKKYSDSIIVVTGSLYLLGEVREIWYRREEVEKKRKLRW